MGKSGIQYTTQHCSTLGAGPSYITYKGGVWDFTPGSGYIKLLGRWGSSTGGEPDVHVTLDSTTFICTASGRQGQIMLGAIDSSIYMTNTTFSTVDTTYAIFPANTATSNPSTNNTVTIVDSTIATGGFRTDYPTVKPTVEQPNYLNVTFDGSTLNMSSTVDCGSFFSYNTLCLQNGSTLTVNSGAGIRVGVESALATHNKLEIKDSTVSLSSGLPITIGYNLGTTDNEGLIENSTITALGIRVGSPNNTMGSENKCLRNKLTIRNSTLNLTDYYPVFFGGRDGKLVFDNQKLQCKSEKYGWHTYQFGANGKDRIGNELDLLNGSVLECAAFVMGSYNTAHLDNNGNPDTFTATNNTLVVGNDSKLIGHSQFMSTGLDNTVVISNGTIDISASQYAFYLGYRPADDETKGLYYAPSSGFKLYLQGTKPLLIVTNTVGNAQCNIGEDTVIDVTLPVDGQFEQIPIQANVISIQHSGVSTVYPTLHFEGLDALVTNITEEMDIVLMKGTSSLSDFYYARNAANNGQLKDYPGCTLKQDFTNKELVLHVSPHYVGSIIRNGATTSYARFSLLSAALADGDIIKMLSAEHETLPVSGKSATLNLNGFLPWDMQLTDGAAVRMSSASTSLQYGQGGVAGSEKTGYNLMVKDSTLTIPGQFMVCGSNNTVVIDNGTIDVTSKYAIYLGYMVKGTTVSTNNTIIIRGKHPVLKGSHQTYTNEAWLADSDAQIQHSKIIMELPTDPADIYTEAPFQSGNSFYIPTVNDVQVEFKNLAALKANLKVGVKIPLVWLKGRSNGIDATAFRDAEMPAGCSIVYEQGEGEEHVYLAVDPDGAESLPDCGGAKALVEGSTASVWGVEALSAKVVQALKAKGVTSITVGADVSSVDAQAFSKFYGLQSVTFKNAGSMTVNDYAFLRCNSLESIVFEGTAPDLGENAITLQAAIYMKDGIPEVYTIPTVTVNGYTRNVYGTNELKGDETSWTLVTSKNQSQFHFFKVVLEKNK